MQEVSRRREIMERRMRKPSLYEEYRRRAKHRLPIEEDKLPFVYIPIEELEGVINADNEEQRKENIESIKRMRKIGLPLGVAYYKQDYIDEIEGSYRAYFE